ncbi:helix-turn-helix transcriptional regulator [Mucilaginibacter sp. dw_454]|uniref:helix-turn-helix domain-containing protein n=1 Tax=Mucilaginibacter sp. dw_454 TaxID=2720079 RepID=UPI00210284CB|nr:helix-turn-helix transcriptional regulator [Mucilaginibacter sp. dw_454]
MTTLGSTIRELREAQNWPQRKLANELDMDVAVLSRIENENKFPKKRIDDIIEVLSRLFSVKAEDLKKAYLSDEIASLLIDEKSYESILKASKEKIIHLRSKELVKEV